MKNDLVRLSQVTPGKTVIIKSFDNDELLLKLMEMGCLPGEKVKVEREAPFGDPVQIFVSGYNLSLRLEEAEQIWVDVI